MTYFIHLLHVNESIQLINSADPPAVTSEMADAGTAYHAMMDALNNLDIDVTKYPPLDDSMPIPLTLN